MKKKYSCGIALFRENYNNDLEIVMIQKRYTFQFFNFVMGCYENKNEYLIDLFSHMTSEEKLAIYNLDFEAMWYILWLTKPSEYVNNVFTKRYISKKIIFEKNFLPNNGSKIKKIIDLSDNSDTQWEIPKGRKEKKETDIDTAIREFIEETGFRHKDFNILLNEPPITESFIDGNVSYINKYFLAIPYNINITPKLRFSNKTQSLEIRAIRWIKESYIDTMIISENHKARIRNLFNRVSKKTYYLRSSLLLPNQNAIVVVSNPIYKPESQEEVL